MFPPSDLAAVGRAGLAGPRRQMMARAMRAVRDMSGDNGTASRSKGFGNDRGLEAGDRKPDQGADCRRARLASSLSLMRQSQAR